MVLAVNNGETLEQVARVAAERGYRFPVATDRPGGVLRTYGVVYRPTTVIIGPEGTVRAVRVGAHNAEAMRAELQRHELLPGR